MGKSIRLRFAEWVFNRFLRPFEQVVIAQKVLAKKANDPEVRANYEKAFGATRNNRTVSQWNNLVRVYGLETVAKVEGLPESEIKLRCRPMAEQIKAKFKEKNLKRV